MTVLPQPGLSTTSFTGFVSLKQLLLNHRLRRQCNPQLLEYCYP
jgi:hypothetical protein